MQRIVSLVPSLTELLYDLGLDAEVAGITKFCVHPAHWFATKARVGGTKSIKPEAIKKLDPTLIIANKEENVREQVLSLAENYRVHITDISNITDAINAIAEIGALTGKAPEAGNIIAAIKTAMPPQAVKLKVAYLIWQKPYMSIGGDTFISDMLMHGGFDNVFKDRYRYPETTVEELAASEAEYILLSSEPYPFGDKHAEELSKLIPEKKVLLIDGEMCSWYGSRTAKGLAYLRDLYKALPAL